MKTKFAKNFLIILRSARAPSIATVREVGGAIMRKRPNLWTIICGLLLVYAASSSSAHAQTFVPTGSMTSPRLVHTATLLNNGKVLIMGGCNNFYVAEPGCVYDSAELYDPATGSFTPTGSMTTPRYFPTATLLSNGKVLIAGGHSGSEAIATAELYDPATGTFTATGSMTISRHAATATRLNDGKVLVAGGWTGGATGHVVDSAELYEPTTGTFTTTGSMTTVRSSQAATLLNDGKVLLTGGNLGRWGAVVASAELYDPMTGTFTATGSMTVSRDLSQAILLNNGKVLIAGGWTLGGGTPPYGTNNADLYDPATGTFAPTGSLSSVRYAHTGTLLSNGKVLIVGGGIDPGVVLASAEIYDPTLGKFTVDASMTYSRVYHTATLLKNGTVLITGGANYGALASAELYKPTNQTPQCVQPPSGLVAWWPGSGNANDVRGGHHGALQNGVSFGPGMVGQAFEFDGLDDYILVADEEPFDFGGDPFSISVWVKTEGGRWGNEHIVFKGTLWGGNDDYVLWVAGEDPANGGAGRVSFQYRYPLDGDLLSTNRVADGTWHHIAVTQSGSCSGCLRLYVDGVLEDTQDGRTLVNSSAPFIIGADYDIGYPAWGNIFSFNGSIDELAVFNRAFTYEEVKDIFMAGSAGMCANRPPLAYAGDDQTVVYAGPSGTLVTLDGSASSDPDGDSLTYTWTGPFTEGGGTATGVSPTITLPLGESTITLIVNDGAVDSSSSDTVRIVVNYGVLGEVGPAQIWLGLKNSDDVGTKFDLLAEVFKNGSLVGSGQLNDVPGGSSGFNNAVLRTIIDPLSSPVDISVGDTLSIRLSVRIAVGVTGHRSGTARLWFNDTAANSRFGVTIGGTANDYFLLNGFAVGTAAGPGPKKTIDVFVDRAVGGNPFKPFGTWGKTF
jgi:hypothetical protein